MNKEERRYYVECGQALGAAIGIVAAPVAGFYKVHYGNGEEVGTAIVFGAIAGYNLGFVLAAGAMVVERIRNNDWEDIRERMQFRRRWNEGRSIDDDL
ncbi:MAG: hypothetical protein AABX98_04190 [Nanoarchaeota archaeon]